MYARCRRLNSIVWLVLLVHLCAGCAGTKMLKEPIPVELSRPLASGSDEQLHVDLLWVIVRDGPGSWAKNVDWDEYLIRIKNVSDNRIDITGFTVVDSQGTLLMTFADRAGLVRASKAAVKRYKSEDIEIKAGMGAGELALGAAGAGVAAPALALSAYAGGGGAAAAAGAVGFLLLAPALAVGGVVRHVNNSNVAEELKARQSVLPATLSPTEDRVFDLFFPLAPSPLRIEFQYKTTEARGLLRLNTESALKGLHLSPERP